MKLSIITPCTRPLNLPAIYGSILEIGSDKIEWIIVYDSNEIDKRIKQYESFVPIILTNKKGGFAYASDQRNKGLELVNGKWIYYLDDDNLIHPILYGDENKVLIFNQFSINRKRRIKDFKLKNIKHGFIDTAQIIVPSKYKYVKWSNERAKKINSSYAMEETDYLWALINEAGDHNIKFIDKIFAYRNYLRRYQV